MKTYGLDIRGNTLVERLETKPVWSSAYEGRLIYAQDVDELYFGAVGDWRRTGDIPSGEIILFEKDTVVLGYTLKTDIDDQLVYISKGYANGGQEGGTAYDGSTWTQPSHSHTVDSHSHAVDSHSHTVNAHTHTIDAHSHSMQNHTHAGPSHTHSMQSHTHTGPSHTHTGPSHTHTVPSHVHKVYDFVGGTTTDNVYNSAGSAVPLAPTVMNARYSINVGYNTAGPQDMYTSLVSGNTEAGGTGATGAGGTGATGQASVVNTGAEGTGATGIPSTASTASTGLTSNSSSPGTDTVAGSTATASPGTDSAATSSLWRPAGRVFTRQQRV